MMDGGSVSAAMSDKSLEVSLMPKHVNSVMHEPQLPTTVSIEVAGPGPAGRVRRWPLCLAGDSYPLWPPPRVPFMRLVLARQTAGAFRPTSVT